MDASRKKRVHAVVSGCFSVQRILQSLVSLEAMTYRSRSAYGSSLVDLCPAHTDSLLGCLMYDENDTFDSCRTCVSDALSLRHGPGPVAASTQPIEQTGSAGVESCQDLEFVLCSALSTCPCPSCRREFAESLFCIMETKLKLEEYDGRDQCRFACPDLPSEGEQQLAVCATASGDARSERTEGCNAHRISAARCYVENRMTPADAAACHSCVVHSFSADGMMMAAECDHQARAVCRAVSDCPCDPCQAQEALYWDCIFQATHNCTLSACDVMPRSYFTSILSSSVSPRVGSESGNSQRLSRHS